MTMAIGAFHGYVDQEPIQNPNIMHEQTAGEAELNEQECIQSLNQALVAGGGLPLGYALKDVPLLDRSFSLVMANVQQDNAGFDWRKQALIEFQCKIGNL